MKFRFNVLVLVSVVASLIQPALSMEERRDETPQSPPTKRFKRSGETEPRDPIVQYNVVIDYLLENDALDAKQAINPCLEAARAGHREAELLVESMGEEAPQTKKQATKWLAEGLYNLTRHSEIPQVPARLEKIAQTAARLGHAEAQYELAERYRKANDIRKSVPWYKRAKKQGHSKAAFKLGEYYVEGNSDDIGEIIPQDLSKALKLFSEASKDPSNKARFIVSTLDPAPEGQEERLGKGFFRLANRELTREDIDYKREDIGQNFIDAEFHYGLAAKLGHEQAKANLDKFFTSQHPSTPQVREEPKPSFHSIPPSLTLKDGDQFWSTTNPISVEPFTDSAFYSYSRRFYPEGPNGVILPPEQLSDENSWPVDQPVWRDEPPIPPQSVVESSSHQQNWNSFLADSWQQPYSTMTSYQESLRNLDRLLTKAFGQAVTRKTKLNYNLLLWDYYSVASAFGEVDTENKKNELLASTPNLHRERRESDQDIANCWYNLAIDAQSRRKDIPLAIQLYHLAYAYGSLEAENQVDRLKELFENQVPRNM